MHRQKPSHSARRIAAAVKYSTRALIEPLESRRLLAVSTPFSGTPAPIPGRIEAENFDLGAEGVAYHDTTTANEGGAYRSTGVDLEATGDSGAGYDVGWAHSGEWLKYTTNVVTAGNYDLAIRTANVGSGGAFHVEVDGTNVTGTLAVPDSNAYQTYTTVTKSAIPLTAGQHVLRLVMDGNSPSGFTGNFNWLQFTATTATPPPAAGPYTGTPIPAGSNIEAENFDLGGEGVGYHSISGINEGGQYRPADHIGLEATGDAGGGFDVGWTRGGEWLNYTINVATAGNYDLAARVASAGAGGTFHVEFAGVNQTGAISVPNTGAWQTYATVTKSGISLAAGTYVMRVVADAAGGTGFAGNFNWFKLTPSTGTPPPPPASTPFTGTPIPAGSVIEAENFDLGADGVAYHDTTAANEGGAYRSTGVDLEATGDAGSGYDVGWTHAGEWLNYTINVPTAGNYDLTARAASSGAGGTFQVEFAGIDKTGAISVPNTGGWQTYNTLTKPGISLAAGTYLMRVAIDGSGPSGFAGNFNWFKLTASAVAPPTNWVPYATMVGQDAAASTYPTLNGSGVTVVVIDRGIDYNAPQIGAGKIVTGYNFRDNNTNILDDYGHGTGVAGIIAGSGFTLNNQYDQGLAPNARLIDLKQESSAGVKAALDWVITNQALYNIQVINLTDFETEVLPGSFNPDIYQSELKTIHDMGVFISTPVGNGEVAAGPNLPITYPALSPYVTGAGGVDLSGKFYADSRRGPGLQILGPASNVTMPYYVRNPNSVGYDQYDDNYDGAPALVNYALGTSWAAAYVSGTAALIKQIYPAFTPDQIQQILKDSGTPVLDPTNNISYPRLNVQNAIALAYQRVPAPPPPPPVLTVGANVNASKVSGSESTGQIAINPTNANNLVVVSQSGANSGAQLPLSRSFNGGATWTTSLVGSQDGFLASNPRPDAHVAFDAFGNLYLTYLVGAATGDVRVAVLRSIDGGQTFTSLGSAVAGANPDAPWIATGPSAANSSQQAVWISYTDFTKRRVMIVGGTSSGLGNFSGWSGLKTVSQSFGTFSGVAVGVHGEIAVSWQSRSNGAVVANSLTLNSDSTGTGDHFSGDQLAASINVGGLDPIPAQPDRTIDAEPRIAFDASSSSTRGRLYLAYVDQTASSGSDTDIYLKYSDNLGASWSTPVRVNDDNSGRSQFNPAIAVDPTTGIVGLSWLDARNNAANTGVQLFSTVSLDHGASVQPNVQVSAGTSFQAGANPNTNDLDFGDSGGLIFNAGKLIPVWSDNSNSTGDNPDGTGRSLDIYSDVIIVQGH